MKTAVFIDGYNFYYGLLKSTPYKWLNIRALMDALLHEQNPACEILQCGFYTAMAKARMATKGQQSVQAQQIYHRALESPHTPDIRVIAHHHDVVPKEMPTYIDGANPDKQIRTKVWSMTEKMTDVCLSLDAYRAAASGKFGQIILVSSDTDFEPLLEAIESDFPEIVRGLITPRKRQQEGRPVPEGLGKLSTWVRSHVPVEMLVKYQFPERVPTAKKPADKPNHW